MRSLDDTAVLDKYIELKSRISELTEELDGLKGKILYALMDEPEEKADYKGCAFSIQRRKTWAYSENVKGYEKELKALKKLEQANGTAEMTKDSAILVMKVQKVKQ